MSRKYTIENLTRLAEAADRRLTPAQRSARTRAATYGTADYGLLPTTFPVHYRAFRQMHDHANKRDQITVSSTLSLTTRGLINFILTVGSYPGGMATPTLVRKSHNRGFQRGNIEWVSGKVARQTIGQRNANRV